MRSICLSVVFEMKTLMYPVTAIVVLYNIVLRPTNLVYHCYLVFLIGQEQYFGTTKPQCMLYSFRLDTYISIYVSNLT